MLLIKSARAVDGLDADARVGCAIIFYRLSFLLATGGTQVNSRQGQGHPDPRHGRGLSVEKDYVPHEG